MTASKLYAIKTSDTDEFVEKVRGWMKPSKYYLGEIQVLKTPPTASDLFIAQHDTGHPCEWKEVVVLTEDELEQKEREAFEAAIRISAGYATEEDGLYHVTLDDMWNQYKQSKR